MCPYSIHLGLKEVSGIGTLRSKCILSAYIESQGFGVRDVWVWGLGGWKGVRNVAFSTKFKAH